MHDPATVLQGRPIALQRLFLFFLCWVLINRFPAAQCDLHLDLEEVQSSPVVIQLKGGAIRGTVENGYRVFKGNAMI